MAAIKHLEKLRNAAYFRDGELPCIIREMREAPGNTFIAMHDHEFSELVIVAEGKVNHIHTDRTDRLSKGAFFVIHPGRRHGYAELAPKTVVFNLLYHCNRPPLPLMSSGFSMMDIFFPANPAAIHANTLGRLPRSSLSAVIRLINLIRNESHSGQPMRHTICESLFVSILLYLSRTTCHTETSVQDIPIQEEVNFIAANIGRKLTITDLCGVSGKSASTLHREFKRITGKSPGDYIIDVRVARARALLEQSGATLAAVAREIGFCGASHLLRTLRARTVSPSYHHDGPLCSPADILPPKPGSHCHPHRSCAYIHVKRRLNR